MNYTDNNNHITFTLDVKRPINIKQRVYHNFLPDDVQDYLNANQMYQPDYYFIQENGITYLYLDNNDVVMIESQEHYLNRMVDEGMEFFKPEEK